MDNDMTRAVHFTNLIDDAMTPYKTFWHKRKKERQQLPITMFLTCTKLPAMNPLPSPSVDPEDLPPLEGAPPTSSPPDETSDVEAASEEL